MWFLLYSLFIFNIFICICHNNSNDFFFISFNNKKMYQKSKKKVSWENERTKKYEKKMFKIFFCLLFKFFQMHRISNWLTMYDDNVTLGKNENESLSCKISLYVLGVFPGAVKSSWCVLKNSLLYILYTKYCFHTHTHTPLLSQARFNS